MKIKLYGLRKGKNLIIETAVPEEIGLPLDIFNHDIKIELTLEDLGDIINADYVFNAQCFGICDRCACEFEFPLKAVGKLYFMSDTNYGPEPEENLKFFHLDFPEVDLTQDILDAMALALPLKLLCRDDCQGLCPHCGTDLNYETCDCHRDKPDSRWEKLAELKGKSEP